MVMGQRVTVIIARADECARNQGHGVGESVSGRVLTSVQHTVRGAGGGRGRRGEQAQKEQLMLANLCDE